MKFRKVSFVTIVTVFLASAFAIASDLWPLDKGTVNALSTTAENCFPKQTGRSAFCLSNPITNTIDARYIFADTDTAVATTTSGIELKPGDTDCYPIGGEPVFKGRVSCIAESGTPSIITWGY